MKFTPAFLDDLKNRVVLSTLIGARVKLKKQGQEFAACCPFHKEKTPSFTVSDMKGFYHCFGCGAHGDAIRFLQETENLSFSESVERLAEMVGVPLPAYTSDRESLQDRARKVSLYEIIEEASKWFETQLYAPIGQNALTYLQERGIRAAEVKKFRIGFAPSANGLKKFFQGKGIPEEDLIEAGLLIKNEDRSETYDRFRQRLMFPITDKKNKVVAFGGRILGEGKPKYLNSPETPIFHKGSMLYGYVFAREAVSKNQPIIVTEGYLDVIALHKGGFVGAVAPLGTALTEEQIMGLWRLSPEPILCFDGDDAGYRAAVRACHRVLPLLKPGFSLQFVHLPKGEDPDSLIQGGAQYVLTKLFSQAMPLVEMVWQSELSLLRPKTPEQEAQLKHILDRHVRHIEDSSVQESYRHAMKNKFYHHFRKRKFFLKKGQSSARDELPKKNTHFDPTVLQRKILLATVVNHPDILTDVIEEFAALTLPLAEHEALKQEILNFAHQQEMLDVVQLKHHLGKAGHGEVLESLLSSALYLHAAFALPKADRRQALEGWQEIWKRLNDLEYTKPEMREIQKSLSATLDEDSWQRLKAIKGHELEEDARGIEI